MPDCPYLIRWVLDFWLFSIRLHKWLGSDDGRAYHDHPWWFITIVLWGSYIDDSGAGLDKLQFGSVRFRPATHRHTVSITSKPTWTLLITGRERRTWGFWPNGKFLKRNKYFFEHGHHQCE